MSRKIPRLFHFLLICVFVFTIFPTQSQASKSNDIIAAAKKHIGVPYKFGGTTPKGFDCSGFINYVFKEAAGIELGRTAADQYKQGQAVKKSDLAPGDLVFFETYKSGASHSGIYIGDSKFIHASTSQGVTISSINDPYYWSPKYLGAKRVLSEENTQEQLISALEPGEFIDVPKNHWANTPVTSMSLDNIISGVNKGVFEPNGQVTRAQAAVLIANAKPELKASSNSTSFTDVANDHWAKSAIAAVTEAGYFPVSGTSFEPNKPLTRAEVAVLVTRAFGLEATDHVRSFNDVAADNWAISEINAVASNEIMSGFPDHTYRPNASVTRAEFATILHSLLY